MESKAVVRRISSRFSVRSRGVAAAGSLVQLLSVAGLSEAGSPAAGWCLKPDMNLDRQIDIGDVPPFVDAVLTDTADPVARCAADTTLDSLLDGHDVARMVEVMLDPDSDGDGIPDLYETDDGVFSGPTTTGSSPSSSDTDGDGLPDGDEVFDTLAGLDLHAMGASPVRQDLFVEVDWFDESQGGPFHSHRPTAAVVASITGAFAGSPVANPYGAPNGISLHVDYGQGGALTGGNLIPGGDFVVVFDSEFNTYKAANFAANRSGYFHYSIFCHHYNSTSNFSSGFAEILGDDFVVSLQLTFFTPYIAQTMMHELGHNLGLLHGGNTNLNFKPSYNSVMNYRYQFDGADGADCDAFGDLIIDYSYGDRIALNENNLDEAAGVCGSVAIDWDASLTITAGVARNVTCYSGFTTPCGILDPACGDRLCNPNLSDYNDWANLTLSGLTQGDRLSPEIITCQDTPAGAK